MEPTLYGPDGRLIPPPLSNIAVPELVESSEVKNRRGFRQPPLWGHAPAIVTSKKSIFNPGAEDDAITQVAHLSAGTERFMPVWFGGRAIGYIESHAGSLDVTYRPHPVGMKPLPLGFTGVSTYDDIIAALSAGRAYRANFSKSHTSTPVISNYYDLWPVAGNPVAGTYTGTALTLRQFTDATTGALFLNGNVEPTYIKQLLLAATVSSGTQPTIILYDRVATYEACTFSTGSQSFVNTLAPQRYVSSGQPGLNFLCTGQTVLGATAAQISALTYTNQAGTAAQAMPTTRNVFTIASAAAPTTTLGARVVAPADTGAALVWSQYLPVAQGDTGARQLTAFTCSAANTGTLCFVGLREYMWIPMGTTGLPTQIDNVLQIGGLDRIYDGACLSFLIYFPAATVSTISGFVKAVWN